MITESPGDAQRPYLPGYHQLHEIVDKQVAVAEAHGSRLTRTMAHSNINRMLNSLFGIKPGQRGNLSSSGRSIMSVAQVVAERAVREDLERGGDHKTSYQRAKDAVTRLLNQIPIQSSELLLQ